MSKITKGQTVMGHNQGEDLIFVDMKDIQIYHFKGVSTNYDYELKEDQIDFDTLSNQDDIQPLIQTLRQYGYIAKWIYDDKDINIIKIVLTFSDKNGNEIKETINATKESVLEWLYDRGLIYND